MEQTRGALNWISWYNKHVGFRSLTWLTLPTAVALLALAFLGVDIREPTCFAPFLALWAWLVFNALMLLLNAHLMDNYFTRLLAEKRRRGLPIDAMTGISTLRELIRADKSYAGWLFIMALASLAMFIVGVAIIVVAAHVAVIGLYVIFGLATMGRREVLYSPEDVIRSYRPEVNPAVLEEPIYGFLETVLDPINRLKLDEYKAFLSERTRPGLNVGDVMGKAFFLLYQEAQGVIGREVVRAELSEVLAGPEQVEEVERSPVFGLDYLMGLVERGRKFVPTFFKLLDRLYITIYDNLPELRARDTYVDAEVIGSLRTGDECHVMVFLFNNTPEQRAVEVAFKAPGFSPDEGSVLVELPGRDFELPEEDKLPLHDPGAPDTGDVVGLLSRVLDNLRVVWFTITADSAGTKSVSIHVREFGGRTLFGVSRRVNVGYRLGDLFRKLVGAGGTAGGIAASLIRVFFWG